MNATPPKPNTQTNVQTNGRTRTRTGFPPPLASGARPNLGLLDQVAALHWIQANVGSFGGSPNRVTLMGSKQGAIFVHLLMLSPLAKGECSSRAEVRER